MTYMPNPQTVARHWLLVDGQNRILGRLASEIAKRLRGKCSAEYVPHADVGDYIVVINASQIKVTGNKAKNKLYHRHTGYIGHLKTTNFQDLQAKHPTRVLELAVKGMLPKGPLGRQMFRKLKVYPRSEHPHQAQKPEAIDF